jgi:hypothetical protein
MKRYGTKSTKNRYGWRMAAHPHIGSGRSRNGKECRRQQNRRVLAFKASSEAAETEKCAAVREALRAGASEAEIHVLILNLWPSLRKTYKRKSER